MSKYVFVGDVHGKWEAVEEALSKDGIKIFVGDFIDSYDRSLEDHRKCYDLLFPEIEKGNAISILGNHELSYLNMHHRCSGYDLHRQMLMHEYSERIQQLFVPYLFLKDNWLITHAGFSGIIFNLEKLDLSTIKNYFSNNISNNKSSLHGIGKVRGGYKPVGGIYWCHFPQEFEPISGLNQIFGHTRGKGIRNVTAKDSVNYCIDCLDFNIKTHLTLEI